MSMLKKLQTQLQFSLQNMCKHDLKKTIIEAIKDNNFYVVESILKTGLDVNFGNSHKDTTDGQEINPLIIACHLGFTKIVELLVDSGANIDVVTPWGTTPIMFAAEEKHIDCVKILLSHNANLYGKENKHLVHYTKDKKVHELLIDTYINAKGEKSLFDLLYSNITEKKKETKLQETLKQQRSKLNHVEVPKEKSYLDILQNGDSDELYYQYNYHILPDMNSIPLFTISKDNSVQENNDKKDEVKLPDNDQNSRSKLQMKLDSFYNDLYHEILEKSIYIASGLNQQQQKQAHITPPKNIPTPPPAPTKNIPVQSQVDKNSTLGNIPVPAASPPVANNNNPIYLNTLLFNHLVGNNSVKSPTENKEQPKSQSEQTLNTIFKNINQQCAQSSTVEQSYRDQMENMSEKTKLIQKILNTHLGL